MVWYRDHRGSLDGSLKTLREVLSFAELFEYLRDDLAHFGYTLTPDNLIIEPYIPDDRIGWTRQFLVRVAGIGPVGYTDGPLDHHG